MREFRLEFRPRGLTWRVEVVGAGRLTRDGLEVMVRVNGGRPVLAFYGPVSARVKGIIFAEPQPISGWPFPVRTLRLWPGPARTALEEAYEMAAKEAIEDAERYRAEEPARYVILEGPSGLVYVYPEFDWQPRHELPRKVRNRYAQALEKRLREDQAFRAAVLGRARPAPGGAWVVEASDVRDLEPEAGAVWVCRHCGETRAYGQGGKELLSGCFCREGR